MNPTAGTTWTCPQGHEVAGNFEFCPQDGSPKPVSPSAAWGQTTGPHQPAWGQPSTWQPPSPPKRALPVWGIVAIVAAALIVFGGVIGLVAWAISSANSGGFNNVSTLEDSVRSTYQNSLDKTGTGITVSSVACVSSGDHQYNCNLEFSDGNSVTHHVTVSSDGNRWVSDNTP